MDLYLLNAGHRIRTSRGAEAEVLTETENGVRVRVRYLAVPDDPSLEGTVDLLTAGEVEVLLGIAVKGSWAEEVAVVLHHIAENEESEEGYEALTLKGVPHNVSVTGSDPHSAEGALNHLLKGLRAFGFTGRVVVDDATEPGPIERYELDVASTD